MINRLKNLLIGGVMVGVIASGSLALLSPASTVSAVCNETLLSFPAWYNGVVDKDCNPTPNAVGGDIRKFALKIVLNVVNFMLRLVGYLCVGYLIYGGFMYIASGGESDRITTGRKIILNAIIGLVLSFFSVALVTIVAGAIK